MLLKVKGQRQALFAGLALALAILVMPIRHGPAAHGAAAPHASIRLLLHGGVVIDGGFTDAYEWVVALGPYPVTSGEAVVTLDVFDVDTANPVTNLDATMLLAPPGSAPCCDPTQHLGPVPLTTDPVAFPGDYSAIVPFETAGPWAIQFTAVPAANSPRAETLRITVEFEVEARGSATSAPQLGAPNAATSTVFAQRVASARASLDGGTPQPDAPSPLAPPLLTVTEPYTVINELAPESPLATAGPIQQRSPLPASSTGEGSTLPGRWWLWGVLLLAPVAALAGWMLWDSPGESG